LETGGCPHTPIGRLARSTGRREELEQQFQIWIWAGLKAGGDNLAASFSPELVDLCIYVMSSAGDQQSRQGRSGITARTVVINKIDLASMGGPQPGGDATRHERMVAVDPGAGHQLAAGRGA